MRTACIGMVSALAIHVTASAQSPPRDQSGATPRPIVPVLEEQPTGGVGILRMEGGLQGAFGGEVVANVPAGSVSSAAIRPAIGVYVRGDIRLSRYFFFRPDFRWRSVRSEGLPDRFDHFALSVGIGVSRVYDFRPGPSVQLEVLGVLSAGIGAVDEAFVFDRVDVSPDFITEAQTEFGVRTALTGGVIVWMHPHVGLAIMVGYERGDFFPNRESGDRGWARFQRALVEVGASIRLGR